jgi:hypothetical protein
MPAFGSVDFNSGASLAALGFMFVANAANDAGVGPDGSYAMQTQSYASPTFGDSSAYLPITPAPTDLRLLISFDWKRLASSSASHGTLVQLWSQEGGFASEVDMYHNLVASNTRAMIALHSESTGDNNDFTQNILPATPAAGFEKIQIEIIVSSGHDTPDGAFRFWRGPDLAHLTLYYERTGIPILNAFVAGLASLPFDLIEFGANGIIDNIAWETSGPTTPTPVLPEPGSQIDNSKACCDTGGGGGSVPGPVPPPITPTFYRSCTGGGTVPTASDVVEAVDWADETPPKEPDVCLTIRGLGDEADERWSLKPLSDTGRFAAARIESISTIERRSSDKDGNYTPARVKIQASDDDGVWRERLRDPARREVINREAVLEIHDYASRKAGLAWMPLSQGRIVNPQPGLDRRSVLELQDIVGAQFGTLDPDKLIGVPVGDEHPGLPETSKGRCYNFLLGEKTTAPQPLGAMPVVDCGDTFIDGQADPEGRTFDDALALVVDQAIVNLIPGGDIVTPTFGMVAKLVGGAIGPTSQVISLDTNGNGAGGPSDPHTHRGVWMDPGGAAGDFIYFFFQKPAWNPRTNPAGDPTVRYKVISGTHTNPAFPPNGAGTWDLYADFDSLTDGLQWGPLRAGPPEDGMAAPDGATGTTEWVYSLTSITRLGESQPSAPIVVSNGPAVLTPTDSITITAELPSDSPDAVEFVRIVGRRANPPTMSLVVIPVSGGSPPITWTDDGTAVETAFNRSSGDAPVSENQFAWIACGLGDGDIHRFLGSDGAEQDTPKRRVIGWEEGTIVGPLSAAWPHPEPYRVVGGIRQFGVYARGLPLEHHRKRIVTFAWDGCGWKDPDGLLVNQAFPMLLLFLNEMVEKNGGLGYRDGDYGPIETFADGTPKFLVSKFTAAQDKTIAWMADEAGLGAIGTIVVTEFTPLREILRRFFNDYGGHGTTNHRGQWYPYYLDKDAAPGAGRLFAERREISRLVDHGFKHDERENFIEYSFNYNYDTQTFATVGVKVKDDTSIDDAGGDQIGVFKTTPKQCYYCDDAATLAWRWGVYQLGIYSYSPRYASWSTNLRAIPDANGDPARFTHRKEGLGLNGEAGTPGQLMHTKVSVQPYELVQTAMLFRQDSEDS